MSKFNWRNGFSVGLIAGICLALLLIFVLTSETSNPINRKTDKEQCDSSPEKCAQEDSGFNGSWSVAQRFVSAEDTLAQWAMAVLGLFATGISAYAVHLLRRTLDETAKVSNETIRSVDLLQKGTVLQNRAYLNLSRTAVRRTRSDHVEIKIVLKNSGQTPANDVRLYISSRWSATANTTYPAINFSKPLGHAVLMRDEEYTYYLVLEIPIMEGVSEEFYGVSVSVYASYKDTFGQKRRVLYAGWISIQHILGGSDILNSSAKHNRCT